MERVSSVMAFLCRHLGAASKPDIEVQDLFVGVSPIERRILELLVQLEKQPDRVRQLREETGEAWSTARYERAERLALSRLRRALQQRDLLRP